jgi:hypothetical protein
MAILSTLPISNHDLLKDVLHATVRVSGDGDANDLQSDYGA